MTAEQGRQVVSLNKKQGADFIKIYEGVSREAYFALVKEAKRQRIPFAGHVPLVLSSFDVSDAGQSEHRAFGKYFAKLFDA